MRQVLLNSQGALIARMPKPALTAGHVLVKVHYSMVSVGTEIAALQPVQAEASNAVSATLAKSTLAVKYLGKAIKNPRKAVKRVNQILQHRVLPHVVKQSANTTAVAKTGTDGVAQTYDLPATELDQQGWHVGYSAVGEVVAVGEGIQDINVGDLVACAGAGKANHADYISIPRQLACPLPEGCSEKAAASTTIGTIALQGVRRTDPKLGETIAVIGLGLLGQITAQLLKANGCRVFGLDLDPTRVAKAQSLGIDAAYTDQQALLNQLQSQTQHQGADATIITAATKSDAVINHAMQITRRKGRVVIVGDVGLAAERANFYKKEIDLLMSTSYGPGRYDTNYEEQGQDYPYAYVRWTLNRNMSAYLNLIKTQQIDIEALIDKVVSIDDAPALYASLVNDKNSKPLGVVIEYPADKRHLPQANDAKFVKPQGHRQAKQGPNNYMLVGTGAFGTCMLVPTMDKLKQHFFLKGVVSRDAAKGGNYVRQQGLEIHASDLSAVLNNDDVDMLVIATRHCEHAEQVIASLNAGKHVFVEKPLALTWDELDRVYTAYKKLTQPPLLMVGFNRRFAPAMQQLKQAITHHNSPIMINYRLNGGYISPEHWIQNQQGGGRNIGEACHIYDCFRYLIDAPVKKIEAQSMDPKDSRYLKNDNFIATLTYEDGSIASLIYTAAGPKQGLGKERLELFSEGEAYVLEDYEQLKRASDDTVLWQGNVDKGHFNELQAWGEALSSQAASPISFAEIIETTAVSLHIEDLIFGRAYTDE